VKTGLAARPKEASWTQFFGVCVLCGIGFTMSLFIGDLGFHGAPEHAEVKLAVFVGSLISAVLGLLVLALAPRPARTPTAWRAWEHT
jgi:Na+:H+ antiporter, NhaA family